MAACDVIILSTQSSMIKVNTGHYPVSVQTNGTDCGIYAIANALELCEGTEQHALGLGKNTCTKEKR